MAEYMDVISYMAAGIVIMGLLTNSLSLSFFLQRQAPSPGTVLLISLNLVDMLVCVSSLATWVHSYWFLDNVEEIPPVSFQALIATSDIMMKTTVFITCLLTITRTLSLVKPLLKIKPRILLMFIGLFILYELIMVSLAFSATIHFKYYWYELAGLPSTLTILIVVSCVISIWGLMSNSKSELDSSTRGRRNADASITVLILAGLFCLFNIPFCVIHVWECVMGPGSLYGSIHNYDTYVLVYSLCVPLNSALNPVVYFVRNQKLRRFILSKYCCAPNVEVTTAFWRSDTGTTIPRLDMARNSAPAVIYHNRAIVSVCDEHEQIEPEVGSDKITVAMTYNDAKNFTNLETAKENTGNDSSI